MSKNTLDHYGWSSPEAPYSCSYLAPEIISILKKLDVVRVLDFGAGNGKLCSIIHQEGFDVVGVEPDRAGIEMARSNYPEIPFYHLGVQDSADALLSEEKQFDVVVSTEVIEHLFSPHLFPLFAKRLLADSGYLVVTTPYHGYLKNLVLSVLNKWDGHHDPLWHGGHIKFWSRRTLSQLLESNGFNIVGFSGVGRVPYLWKSMVLIARRISC